MKSQGLPGIKAIKKQQNYSLHQLSKWNQQIDIQRLKTIHDQQEIKKQKKISKQNSTVLNDSILQVEQEAVVISKQIQEEKTKFQHLSILVKKAEQQIYSQKLQKYEDVINKKQTNEYEQQTKILKEKQKQLEKLFEKLNASEFEISKKIDAIRSLKKDRGFHSNLFDKLEKQYFDVVFYYQQQLIQRKLRERILENATVEFNKVLQKSQEESPQFDIYGTNYGKGLVNFDNRQGQQQKQQQRVSKIPQLRFSRPSLVHNTETLKTKKSLEKSKRTIEDLRKFEFKKKVSQILNDFGCKSYQQFALADINFQSQSHQQVLTQANNYFEQICKLQNSIRQLQAQICQKRDNNQNQKDKNKINAQSSTNKYQTEIANQRQQVDKFKQELYENVGELLKEMVGKDTEGDAQGILQIIRSSKEGVLNFTQDMQVLKEVMTYMNDNVLKGPFPQFTSSKKSSAKTSTQISNQRAKAKKLSLINVQNEIIEGPQNQHRKSQGLNEILRTYQNDNQRLKSKKGQKQHSLSILTQKEFILESKKIITQINKKNIFARANQPINNKK